MHVNRPVSNIVRVTAAALILAAAGMPGALWAQDRPYWGFALGYEFGVPLSTNRVPGLVNRFGVPGNGRSVNHTLLVGAGADFTGWLGSRFSVTPRLSLALSTGSFLSDPFQSDSLLDPTVPRPVEREFELYTTLSGISLDIPLRWRAAGNWSLDAGPWASYRITSGIIQKQRILTPDVTFADGTREATVDAGETLGASRLRAGLLIGTSLQVPLAGRVRLVPQVYARVDGVSLLADGLGRRAVSGGLSLGLLFDAADDARTVPPPDTPRGDGARRLMVAIDLKADDVSDTMTVDLRRTHYRTVLPALSDITFDRDAGSLPSSLSQFSRAQADTFSLGSLARREPGEIHRNALNVLGLRLRADRSATVTLTGYAAPGEPASRGRERALAVQTYLANVWAIDRKRAVVQEGRRTADVAEDTAGMRRVTITSLSPSLTAPVAVDWVVSRWQAPRVGLARIVEADGGIARWELTVRQGDRVIAQDTGTGRTIPEVADGAFVVQSTGAGIPAISAELTVQDADGRRETARDTLRVLRRAEEEGRGAANEIFTYYLFGDEGTIASLVHDIAAAVKTRSIIRVIPCSPGSTVPRLEGAAIGARILADPALRGREDVALEIVHGNDPSLSAVAWGDGPKPRLLAGGVRVVLEQMSTEP